MSRPTDKPPPIVRIDPSRLADVVAVHCDAFFDYPTMRFVIGAKAHDYEDRLALLIGLFLDSTRLRNGIVLGLIQGNEIIAAADIVHSDATTPPELSRRRESVWQCLGDEARARYDDYSLLTEAFAPAAPHYYLSMLGVRRRCAGMGLARLLMERAHALSVANPTSTGVALETEDPGNIPLYQHLGYELVGQVRVDTELESWGFFRQNEH